MTAPTKGWIGIGFSDTSSMDNSDFIIAGVTGDGQGYIYVNNFQVILTPNLILKLHAPLQDVYMNDYKIPTLDDEQNVTLLTAEHIGDKTQITFRRPIKSTDPNDKSIKVTCNRYCTAR